MSEFLLLGMRPQADHEVSPAGVARDLTAAAAWHRWLRRWGLLCGFALPQEPIADVRACLIVRSSGHAAAQRLASGWARVSGYHVTVTGIFDTAAGPGGEC